MEKYGNKIVTILLTAVCLIGVLPLSVYAAYENVYVPPLASLTPDYRPSSSAGAIVPSADYDSYTVPVPLDVSNGMSIVFSETMGYTAVLLLDSEFNKVAAYQLQVSNTYYFESGKLINCSFVVFGANSQSPIMDSILVNNVAVSVVVGSQNLAHQERYEYIEVPDPPTPPTDVIQIQPILDMWEDILLLNATPLTKFYNHLIKPMGLIIGIPLIMALVGIITFMIGGKKR